MFGLQTTVSIGVKSTPALPTTCNRKRMNVYSISGGKTESSTADVILGAGNQNLTDPVLPGPGLDDHRLVVKVPVDAGQFPFWMAAFFGTEAVTGSGDPYTHVWTSGLVLPYVTLEHQLQTGEYRLHYGMLGEQLDIEFDAEKEGFAMATLTFVGIDEVAGGSALAGTVATWPTLDRPAQALANILYNSVSGFPILSGNFSFKRKLKRVRAADGTGKAYDVQVDGISSLDGKIHVRYNDSTLQADALSRTERPLSLQLLRTVSRGVKFDMAHMRLDVTPIEISGPDGVEQDITFKAWQNTSDPALTATVINGTATANL